MILKEWEEKFNRKQGRLIEEIWSAMHFRNGDEKHDRTVNMKIAEAYADLVTEIERLAEKSGANEEMRMEAIQLAKTKKKSAWAEADEAEALVNKIFRASLKASKEEC
ncbi:MAG: hypothetical protein IJ741_06460 [Schwartzia sp.]|nr:hypothetical protein [Schwartzia sp. (in: firmicutes)]